MSDPQITADGMTYEKAAIEKWLLTHDTSPLTGAVLPHKFLTPNYALRSAIEDWAAAGGAGPDDEDEDEGGGGDGGVGGGGGAGDLATRLDFINQTGSDVDIFWVDNM